MSMKLVPSMLIAVMATCASASLPAQTVSEKGMATVTYSSRLAAEDRQEAISKADMNAIERYIANSNAARSRVFEQQRDRVASKVSNYILGSTILSEQDDKAMKSFSVVVRADINATRLLNDLGSGSASTADKAQHQHSMLTFLFVARSQGSVQSYDAKVYKRADVGSSASRQTQEGESIRSNSVGTTDRTDHHSSNAATTGGSITRKADKVEWTVAQAGEINSVMTGEFADAGYDVIEAAQVEGASNGLLNIDAIRSAYSHGQDLPAKMTRDTTQGVRQAGIGLLAMGTLDVGMQDADPVSGNVRVYVTVTGKVYDVRGRFARTISSVGPVQYAGLGPDASVARTNAMKIAAQHAAQQMVDELNNKGIH